MRVNVYGEELTDRIELIYKEVTEESTDKVFNFYGLRFWLKFPNQPWWVHRKVYGEEDDDSSAITIWSDSRESLIKLFDSAIIAIESSLYGS